MKTAVFVEPGKVEARELPKATIKQPTDAVLRIVRACVCGSDLWWFRGISDRKHPSAVGHEAIGVVESVGDEVTHVKPGDFVIAPFTHGCGHCAACLAGFEGNCLNNHPDEMVGYQGEYLRFTNADWSLVKVPGQPSDYTDAQLNDLLTLSDVMATVTTRLQRLKLNKVIRSLSWVMGQSAFAVSFLPSYVVRVALLP